MASPPDLLSRFLRAKKMSMRELARRAGVNAGYLSVLISGDRRAGLAVGVRLEEATGGAVPARAWIEFNPKAS